MKSAKQSADNRSAIKKARKRPALTNTAAFIAGTLPIAALILWSRDKMLLFHLAHTRCTVLFSLAGSDACFIFKVFNKHGSNTLLQPISYNGNVWYVLQASQRRAVLRHQQTNIIDS